MSKKLLKEFVDALDKLVPEDYKDDFSMDVIDPADDDEAGMGKGFTGEDMYNQLGKVLDNSEVDTVTTDDGDTFKVTDDQARILRMLASSEKLKPQPKLKFSKDIQTTAGLTDFLDIKDYHEIPQLFVKRYLG